MQLQYLLVSEEYNNNLRGGPTRFDPRGATLRRAGLYGQARNACGSFPPWVPPIPASRRISSGLYMGTALPPTEMILHRMVRVYAAEGIRGRLWWPKPSSSGPIPKCLGGNGGPGVQEAVQEALRNQTEERAKRYAQCALADMCAQKHMNHCIF